LVAYCPNLINPLSSDARNNYMLLSWLPTAIILFSNAQGDDVTWSFVAYCPNLINPLSSDALNNYMLLSSLPTTNILFPNAQGED